MNDRDYINWLIDAKNDKIKELEEENGKLEEENNKRKDTFMLRLAELYNVPSSSKEMSLVKNFNYCHRYDMVKYKMRSEIGNDAEIRMKELKEREAKYYNMINRKN